MLVLLFGFEVQARNLYSTSGSKFTIETNRVWINVTNTEGAFSQTLMGYRTGATDGVDWGLDGLFMNDGAVALASLIGTTRYAIQFKGLPFSVTDVVPLSFSATTTGLYTFAIDRMDGFFNSSTLAVHIHDKVTNTYTNLKTSNYSFTANAGMYNSRFELTYSNITNSLATSHNTFTSANLLVSQNNDNLQINSGNTILQNISIYSMTGQLLYQNNQVNRSLAMITIASLSQQVIIIKVTTKDDITIAKKWLKL